jgi:endoglucanase
METDMKTDKTHGMHGMLNGKVLALLGGPLLALGCLIPPPSTPSAAPGSAASIHGTAAAAPAAAGAPIALKDCGPNALIDDGEDGNNQNLPLDNRGGYWYTFKDKGTTTVDPQAGEEGGTFAMSEGGHNSQFAARYHGKVGTGAIVFAGLGMNFVDPKGQYDASKYSGITFWAKRGENSTGKVRLKVPDANTDPDGAVCTECFNDFGADMNFTPEWKQYVFPFKNMKQLAGWGNPHKPHILPAKIYGIQFQVNVPSANYDIYIDDLKFICE